MPNPIAYTVRDACTAIGCGRSFLYQLIGAGRLSAVKLNGKTLITSASLHALVDGLPAADIRTGQRVKGSATAA